MQFYRLKGKEKKDLDLEKCMWEELLCVNVIKTWPPLFWFFKIRLRSKASITVFV